MSQPHADGPSLKQRVAALERQTAALTEELLEQAQKIERLEELAKSFRKSEAGGQRSSDIPREKVPISPAMGEVLRLIHAGEAEQAKKALGAIPADERNAQPAVLAIAAAALCIARDDYAHALTALERARQLTDDDRLLRIAELVGQKIPAGS